MAATACHRSEYLDPFSFRGIFRRAGMHFFTWRLETVKAWRGSLEAARPTFWGAAERTPKTDPQCVVQDFDLT